MVQFLDDKSFFFVLDRTTDTDTDLYDMYMYVYTCDEYVTLYRRCLTSLVNDLQSSMIVHVSYIESVADKLGFVLCGGVLVCWSC